MSSAAPDYYTVTGSFAIPNPLTATLVGVSGTLTVDRYLHVYTGFGPSVGKSASAISGSATFGYLLQTNVPDPDQMESFLTGWTVSGGGGMLVGGQATFSPSAHGQQWAGELGLFSPQAGVSATYGWQVH